MIVLVSNYTNLKNEDRQLFNDILSGERTGAKQSATETMGNLSEEQLAKAQAAHYPKQIFGIIHKAYPKLDRAKRGSSFKAEALINSVKKLLESAEPRWPNEFGDSEVR